MMHTKDKVSKEGGFTMVVSIIIGGIIILYSLYVIHRRIKEIKAGEFCGGSCGGCNGCSKREEAWNREISK